MSRYREPICRLCRVEKAKLFLKGNKCLTDKCPIERRAYAPGQHGRSRRRILGYGIQLREKQKRILRNEVLKDRRSWTVQRTGQPPGEGVNRPLLHAPAVPRREHLVAKRKVQIVKGLLLLRRNIG